MDDPNKVREEEQEEEYERNDNIPVPPPIPEPYFPSVLDEDELVDSLTAHSLGNSFIVLSFLICQIFFSLANVTLQKAKPIEKPLKLDNLSVLELAVKRRAEKKVEVKLVEGVSEVIKKVDEIRFCRTLKEQVSIVEEARKMEQNLENGGPSMLQKTNFPSMRFFHVKSSSC